MDERYILLVLSIALLLFAFVQFPVGDQTWDTAVYPGRSSYYRNIDHSTIREMVSLPLFFSALFFLGFCMETIRDRISLRRHKQWEKDSIANAIKEEKLKEEKQLEIIEKLSSLGIIFNKEDPFYKNEFIYNEYKNAKEDGYNLLNIDSGEDIYKLASTRLELNDRNLKYNKEKTLNENFEILVNYDTYKNGFELLQKRIIENNKEQNSEIVKDIDSFIMNNSVFVIEMKLRNLINLLVTIEEKKFGNQSDKYFPIVFRNNHYITYDKGVRKETIMLTDIDSKYVVEDNYIIEKYIVDKSALNSKIDYYSKIYFKKLL